MKTPRERAMKTALAALTKVAATMPLTADLAHVKSSLAHAEYVLFCGDFKVAAENMAYALNVMAHME